MELAPEHKQWVLGAPEEIRHLVAAFHGPLIREMALAARVPLKIVNELSTRSAVWFPTCGRTGADIFFSE